MKILIIGNGGREHALCWKLAQSRRTEKIYCAPGNAGTGQIAENVDIGVGELEKLADFAEQNSIDITVAGPEAPLCCGIVDIFNKRKLKVFGPDKSASRLEGSKSFAKDFMKRNNIPTAASESFTDRDSAIEYIKNGMKNTNSFVVKADGLAAGKGVIIAETEKEAVDAIDSCFAGAFGTAGNKIIIEEFLQGEEASILAFTDGKTVKPLISSQDHKRVGEGDTGLNTGGMGAYCPAPVVDSKLMERIQSEILDNFLNGIRSEGLNYHGIIYAGIMVTGKGPKVLEFNVRFGDPEVQAVMSLLDSDLLDITEKVIDEKLSEAEIKWKKGAAVCVVMASGGYPESYEKGFEITGLKEAEQNGTVVFHAGTALKNGKIVNSGGRVLGVTAAGNSIQAALNKVYSSVEKINWNGAFYRRDIAYRAVNR
ncbi:MAG: phosphoribosylamine--glycine ligase [Victivallales bacterium]|nr:phosphoribosylamine--glycine ligase [Victivallales bacterium]MCF7889127.1 phosphoribosylamine--glycine ligase [Victivallales bacterium]